MNNLSKGFEKSSFVIVATLLVLISFYQSAGKLIPQAIILVILLGGIFHSILLKKELSLTELTAVALMAVSLVISVSKPYLDFELVWIFTAPAVLAGFYAQGFITKENLSKALLTVASLNVALCSVDFLAVSKYALPSPGGFFTDSNLSQALTIGMCLTAVSLNNLPKTKIISILVVLVGFAATLSKSAAVSAILTLILYAIFQVFSLNSKTKVLVLGLTALLATVLGSYSAAFLKYENAQASVSISSRISLLSSSFDMIKENPPSFTGNGQGSWRLDYPRFKKDSDINSAGVYAHSDWIQIYYEKGILGLILMLALLITGIVSLRKAPFLFFISTFFFFNFASTSAMTLVLIGINLALISKHIRLQPELKMLFKLVLVNILLVIVAIFSPLTLYLDKIIGKEEFILENSLYFSPKVHDAEQCMNSLNLLDDQSSLKTELAQKCLRDVHKLRVIEPRCTTCLMSEIELRNYLGQESNVSKLLEHAESKIPKDYSLNLWKLKNNKDPEALAELRKSCISSAYSIDQILQCLK